MNKLSIAGFTNLGYRIHALGHAPIDTDMSGKTVLITGGTGGLGLASATALADLGARVAIVGRSPGKLAAAAASVMGDVVTYQSDLSVLAEVRELADEIAEKEERLDVLVNNVGVLLPKRQVSSEGIELTLATNMAGHFLLTNLLVRKLIETAPSRIINVTSGGMYSERIRPQDLQFESGEYTGTVAYARTKRGQVILTEMWAERLLGSEVVVHSMHPGWAKTAGVASSLPTFNRVMRPFLRTPEQGADTIVWLATSPEAVESTGHLWFDRNRVPTHLVDSTRENESERQALWEGLSELTRSDLTVWTSA